ncbi:MAG: aminopeptidase P family protein [Ignavibacteriaceae bacterium]|nr:aminopeptidase P family protein [Ignavibacteriaceae bacterium]
MFDSKTYTQRRSLLKQQVGSGIILFPGNKESAMNYPANTYRFRQDSNFLYFFGLDYPDLTAVIDVDNNRDLLFGNDFSVDDIVWMGPQKSIRDKALDSGINESFPNSYLNRFIKNAKKQKRKIHYLPVYRGENAIELSELLETDIKKINNRASVKLIESVIEQRSIKSPGEITEIESALEISYQMQTAAMKLTQPGMIERDVAGVIEGIACALGKGLSFPVIFSVHGETLHNHHHENLMHDGDIVVNDSGAESFLHYASDITRTFPVNGRFTTKQKDIYQIVLDAQLNSIHSVKPGIRFKEIHLIAAKTIFEGLKNLGLAKGDTDEAVKAGAHALFFPHGLGHMLGLDVHDMEGLGEDFVGYSKKIKRSKQFGLSYLRLAKELKSGYVFTVEPGIYFIPELISLWKSKKKFVDFINYDKLDDFKNFGGIRIEDDILVTETSHRTLGRAIPKTIEEIEQACQ